MKFDAPEKTPANNKNRKAQLLALCLLLFSPLFSAAQQTELSVHLNSGFFYYGGNGATPVSRINYTTYTNNPYGSKPGFSYGLSFDVRKVTQSNFILGADVGFEMLGSKVDLKYSDVIGDIAADFEGRTYLNTSFINLFPYLGKRYIIKEKAFDLIAGVELATGASAKENGDARSIPDAFHIETSRDRTNLKTDLRPRIQVSANINEIRVYAGYAHGLMNYTGNYDGLSMGTYSRMWRIGAGYILR